jgi:hypothetical protein
MLVQQNQIITLPDRRNLGFAKYGGPNGKVFFLYTNSQGYAKDAGHFGFMNAWGRICDLMNETPDLTCI